jgi:hypothetical protein
MEIEALTHRDARAPGTIEGDVLFGRRGQLFLARGGHDIFEMATGACDIPPESYAAFRGNIEGRRLHAEAAGVPYVHVIFPDKQSVLREDYVTADPVCLGEAHLRRSPEIAPHVFYPLEMLRQAGKASFLRTDTHLSDHGTIVAVCGLVERITGVEQSLTRDRMLGSLHIRREHVGDLGAKLEPNDSSIEMYAETDWPTRWLHNNLTGGNNGIVDLYFSPEAQHPGRLLWFGDSFGREAARFLSFFFREVILLRTPFFHPDVFDCIRPSLLVTENVERYLARCLPDSARPSFFMFPHLAGLRYEPSQEFARAFSDVLSADRKPPAPPPHGTAHQEGNPVGETHDLNSHRRNGPALNAIRSLEPTATTPVAPSQPEATAEQTIGTSESNRKLAADYGVSCEIHAEDFIYRFVQQRHGGDTDLSVTNYLELGRYSAGLAKEMVAEIGRAKAVSKQPWQPARILDFASGFGCVARHLPAALPTSRIVACDIHPAAVRFNHLVLDIESILSSSSPETLAVPEQDVIFAMSFFSHLPKTTYARWLKALAGTLAPGGALVFTANGHATHRLGITGVTVEPDGFGFLPRSEQIDLDGAEYGITISHPGWVMRTLADQLPELRLTYFREGHWWAVQDTYICVRD